MKLMFPEKREIENIEKEKYLPIFNIRNDSLNELEKICLGKDTKQITKVHADNRMHIPAFVIKIKQMLFQEYAEGLKKIRGNNRENVELFNKIAGHFGERIIQIQLKFQKTALEYEMMQGAKQALEDKYGEIKETIKRLSTIKAARELHQRFINWKKTLKQAPTWNYCRIEQRQESRIKDLSRNHFNPSVSTILDADSGFQSGYYMIRHKYKICAELWRCQPRDSWFVIAIILKNKQDWAEVLFSYEKAKQAAVDRGVRILIGGSRYDYSWFDIRIRLERKREKDALRTLERIKQASFKIAEASYRVQSKFSDWKLNQMREQMEGQNQSE